MNQDTTIKIKRETHKELCDLGQKGDTFEDIIKRLIKFYQENLKGSSK